MSILFLYCLFFFLFSVHLVLIFFLFVICLFLLIPFFFRPSISYASLLFLSIFIYVSVPQFLLSSLLHIFILLRFYFHSFADGFSRSTCTLARHHKHAHFLTRQIILPVSLFIRNLRYNLTEQHDGSWRHSVLIPLPDWGHSLTFSVINFDLHV